MAEPNEIVFTDYQINQTYEVYLNALSRHFEFVFEYGTLTTMIDVLGNLSVEECQWCKSSAQGHPLEFSILQNPHRLVVYLYGKP